MHTESRCKPALKKQYYTCSTATLSENEKNVPGHKFSNKKSITYMTSNGSDTVPLFAPAAFTADTVQVNVPGWKGPILVDLVAKPTMAPGGELAVSDWQNTTYLLIVAPPSLSGACHVTVTDVSQSVVVDSTWTLRTADATVKSGTSASDSPTSKERTSTVTLSTERSCTSWSKTSGLLLSKATAKVSICSLFGSLVVISIITMTLP